MGKIVTLPVVFEGRHRQLPAGQPVLGRGSHLQFHEAMEIPHPFYAGSPLPFHRTDIHNQRSQCAALPVLSGGFFAPGVYVFLSLCSVWIKNLNGSILPPKDVTDLFARHFSINSSGFSVSTRKPP